MTNSKFLSRWYKALFLKDCVAIMDLLKEEPSLVKEGWEVDSSRWHDGSPFEGSEANALPWKGRTALHVGATRGCVDLIKQVLLLCNLEAVKNYGVVEEHHTATETRGDLVAKPGQSDSAKSNPDFSLTLEELPELLLSKDGVYELEALAMAAIHYNLDVINLLVYALGECGNPPYGIERGIPSLPKAEHDAARANGLESLRRAFHEFVENLERDVGGDCLRQCLYLYSKHLEFNFLPPEEYFFHFLSSRWGETAIGEGGKNWSSCREDFWQVVRTMKDSVWRFLLELKDGQGRTPFHVALSWSTATQFLKLFPDADQEMWICALTKRDAAGRTPLHRAAATASAVPQMDMEAILRYCEISEEVSATCCSIWLHPLGTLDLALKEGKFRSREEGTSGPGPHRATLVALSRKYGFGRFTCPFNPLHLAVINGQYSNAMYLMKEYRRLGMQRDTWYFKDYRQVLEKKPYFQNLEAVVIEWGFIEFAYFAKAEIGFIEDLVKDAQDRNRGRSNSLKARAARRYGTRKVPNERRSDPQQYIQQEFYLNTDEQKHLIRETIKAPWKAVHLAAAAGDYVMLKTLIDYKYDPLSKDFEGSNALHYALKIRQFGHFRKSILNFVTFETFREEVGTRKRISEDVADDKEDAKTVKGITVSKQSDRIGCINLLMQVGRDIFKYNNNKRAPEPEDDLVMNGQFCSWWFDLQKEEFTDFLAKLNVASNAISVTAALIATASYLGPTAPPLGDDPVQYENGWVATFIFCDLLSFYFAIVAIVVALIPSLPMWQESAVEELQRTQKLVTVAVSLLVPSIICFFIAFISSSIAVETAKITSVGGRLTIAALCIGAPLFFVVIFFFLVRLVAGLFPTYLSKASLSSRWATLTYSQYSQ